MFIYILVTIALNIVNYIPSSEGNTKQQTEMMLKDAIVFYLRLLSPNLPAAL
jgi:hypothetical protein